jgi:hypothetical protein
MSRYGSRPHIESAVVIDLAAPSVARIVRPNNHGSGWWSWSREGETIASVGYSINTQADFGMLKLAYHTTDRCSDERKQVTCRIGLVSMPLHFGGRRWWMVCPYTHRRARRLYGFSGIDQFCHRTAVRPLPTYASQRVSGVCRVQAQRWAIRRKLGDDCTGLLDEPLKPKWMRWRTFRRYASRDAELAEHEDQFFCCTLDRLLLQWGELHS